jgi:hypothetical protein
MLVRFICWRGAKLPPKAAMLGEEKGILVLVVLIVDLGLEDDDAAEKSQHNDSWIVSN